MGFHGMVEELQANKCLLEGLAIVRDQDGSGNARYLFAKYVSSHTYH